jgi:uncharacterized membrane protein
MDQKKYKSWALWLAVAALIIFVWKEATGVDISPTVNNLMNVLLPVLVGFGIVNNPNSKTSV